MRWEPHVVLDNSTKRDATYWVWAKFEVFHERGAVFEIREIYLKLANNSPYILSGIAMLQCLHGDLPLHSAVDDGHTRLRSV